MFYIFSYMSIYFLEREMKIKGSYILPIVHTHTHSHVVQLRFSEKATKI